MSTSRKFPSLRDLIHAIIRPDMLAIREFFEKETTWMRSVIDEQTEVILSLQQLVIAYNDICIQLIDRMNGVQSSINKVIESKADDQRNSQAHTEIIEQLNTIQGQLNGLSASITELNNRINNE